MDWIDNIIVGLTETYNTDNIYELYDFLEIQIIRLDAKNILLQGNDGFYQRNYFNQEMVSICGSLDYQYEKFVLAHELGHAILHTETSTAAFNIKLINSGKIEKQATYFALKLLNIQLDPIELDGLNIKQIANLLHIPKDCLLFV